MAAANFQAAICKLYGLNLQTLNLLLAIMLLFVKMFKAAVQKHVF